MANDVEIRFVDESDFKKQENRYFWCISGRLGEQTSVRATSINNFSGIDISQPTLSVSLSVPSFSLGLNKKEPGRCGYLVNLCEF